MRKNHVILVAILFTYIASFSQAPNLVLNYQSSNINGTDLEASFEAENIGNAPCGATSKAGFYLFIGDDVILDLASYETNIVTFTGDVSGMGIPDGDYYFGCIADYEEVIGESDETDNVFHSIDPLIHIGAIGEPNLILNFNSSNISGMDVDISLYAKNIGTGACQGTSTATFYLSIDNDITGADYEIGDDFISVLHSGDSIEVVINDNLASVAPDGNYYIGCIADNANVITETDETDNTWCSTAADVILQTLTPDTANLQFVQSLNNLTVNGTVIDISLQILNNGFADCSNFRVGYFLSLDANITSSDYFIDYNEVASLNSGETIDLSLSSIDVATLNYMGNPPPNGNWYVGFIVDYWNEVLETTEWNDNIYCFNEQVLIMPTGIDSFDEKNEISIYPNPSNGIFTIEGENIQKVEIIDLAGKTIKQFVINNEQLIFDLSNNTKGIYTVRIITDNSIIVKKIIKQ